MTYRRTSVCTYVCMYVCTDAGPGVHKWDLNWMESEAPAVRRPKWKVRGRGELKGRVKEAEEGWKREEGEVVEVASRMIAWLYCFLPAGHPVCVPAHPLRHPREIYVHIYIYIGVVVAGSSFNNSASRATREEEGWSMEEWRTRNGSEWEGSDRYIRMNRFCAPPVFAISVLRCTRSISLSPSLSASVRGWINNSSII